MIRWKLGIEKQLLAHLHLGLDTSHDTIHCPLVDWWFLLFFQQSMILLGMSATYHTHYFGA
jgi:hypothetical protein